MRGDARCKEDEEKKRDNAGGKSIYIESRVRSSELVKAPRGRCERTWANEHSHAKSFARSYRRRHCGLGLRYMPPDFTRIRKAVMKSAGLFDS
jgi:hypothetical protein